MRGGERGVPMRGGERGERVTVGVVHSCDFWCEEEWKCHSVGLPYTREAAMLLNKLVKSLERNVDLKRRLQETNKKMCRRRHCEGELS